MLNNDDDEFLTERPYMAEYLTDISLDLLCVRHESNYTTHDDASS